MKSRPSILAVTLPGYVRRLEMLGIRTDIRSETFDDPVPETSSFSFPKHRGVLEIEYSRKYQRYKATVSCQPKPRVLVIGTGHLVGRGV
jgi:hypothetical protein